MFLTINTIRKKLMSELRRFEGVRFTIGGTPRELYDNTVGYFDALIIGTKDRQHSKVFDFVYDQTGD